MTIIYIFFWHLSDWSLSITNMDGTSVLSDCYVTFKDRRVNNRDGFSYGGERLTLNVSQDCLLLSMQKNKGILFISDVILTLF